MTTQERTSGTEVATLGLRSVLVGSLPAALMTPDAPDRYTVEAVFTRRPDRDEVVDIVGPEMKDRLRTAGYPTIELTVTDRRLEIANTSLEELRDGLADILSEELARISAGVRGRRDDAAARFRELATRDQERAAAVATLAESVVFRAPVDARVDGAVNGGVPQA